jgi:hypothetical protein
MSEESVQEPNGENADNNPQGEEQQQATPTGDDQHTEQDADHWKAMSRKNEAALKREREARKQLEEKVKGLLTPEEVQSKDQMLASAQREAEAAKSEALRLRVALAEGIPVDLAERLRGTTEEEIREDAQTLKTLVKSGPAAADAKKAVLAEKPQTPPDPNELLRQIIASR